jgi:tetratricopeptide (TPR) repeat protein
MDNWRIPLEGMVCLIIPEHTGSVTPAGLFVIFDKNIPVAEHITHAYTVIGEKLFIPVHASLHPLLSEDEMAALLIWEWQVFHPGIGFTGFNKEDQLEPSELVSFTQPVITRWNLAHPGMPPMARLMEISVDKSRQEELLDQLGKEMDVQPLSDISGQKKHFQLPPLLDFILRLLMMPIWFILKMWSHKGSPAINTLPSLSTSKLQPFFDWVEGRKKSLQHSRNSELERLMHLFDEDMNEALKYAIPLNNPYAGRGTATPSSTLGRHEARFSLGNLGGGGRTDYWNVDNYQESLSAKYYKAAMAAEAAKDFRKAAYIYANLLGNFSSAARVLQQGLFFREAAILYKDHLRKPLEAAECLEKGGLLLEAIEIFKEQEQYERAGDIYMKLSQQEAAFKYYRKSVDMVLLNGLNYIKAAEIQELKLKQVELALATLMDGWLSGPSQEDCLLEYFSTVMRSDETQLGKHLQKVYEQHTSAQKQMQFLSVLVMINNRTTNPAAKDTARELAYVILSKDASSGNTDKLSLLRHFIPDDQQLPADYNRFKNKGPEQG